MFFEFSRGGLITDIVAIGRCFGCPTGKRLLDIGAFDPTKRADLQQPAQGFRVALTRVADEHGFPPVPGAIIP